MTPGDNAKALAATLQSLYGDMWDFPFFPPTAPAAPPPSADALAKLAEEIRYCQDCVLHIGRQHLVFGRGNPAAEIAFVGDFPSDGDDAAGEPFTGEVGELLHKMIVAMKVKPEDVYFTNVFKCRPPAGQKVEQDFFRRCELHLTRQFALLRAPFIVAMGEIAARALARAEAPLPVLRKQIFSWEGRSVICTHHPRDLLRSPAKKKEAWEDLQAAMRAMGSH